MISDQITFEMVYSSRKLSESRLSCKPPFQEETATFFLSLFSASYDRRRRRSKEVCKGGHKHQKKEDINGSVWKRQKRPRWKIRISEKKKGVVKEREREKREREQEERKSESERIGASGTTKRRESRNGNEKKR